LTLIPAGIVLGPSVLGQIPNFTKLIFPQFEDSKYFTNGTKYPITITEPTALKSLDTFGVVANMGLIFFMFLMGLELELDIVKKIWKQSVPISGLQCLLF
jgi:Kef-type K+ transport system membrane component KefB